MRTFVFKLSSKYSFFQGEDVCLDICGNLSGTKYITFNPFFPFLCLFFFFISRTCSYAGLEQCKYNTLNCVRCVITFCMQLVCFLWTGMCSFSTEKLFYSFQVLKLPTTVKWFLVCLCIFPGSFLNLTTLHFFLTAMVLLLVFVCCLPTWFHTAETALFLTLYLLASNHATTISVEK